jgi:hypothetical protein
MMAEFESLRDVHDEKVRNDKLETARKSREKGQIAEEDRRKKMNELRQSIDKRMEEAVRGSPGREP